MQEVVRAGGSQSKPDASAMLGSGYPEPAVWRRVNRNLWGRKICKPNIRMSHLMVKI